jgi:hypothetical protein
MEREGLALLCVGLSHHPFSAINEFVTLTAFIIGPTQLSLIGLMLQM